MALRLVIVPVFVFTMLAAAVALGSDSSPTQALCIEYIGQSDKPIAGIAIGEAESAIQMCSKESSGLTELWKAHALNSTRMSRIIEMAEATPTDQKQDSLADEILAVRTVKPDGSSHLLVLNRAHGAAFLRELGRVCGSYALRLSLSNLQRQIGPRA